MLKYIFILLISLSAGIVVAEEPQAITPKKRLIISTDIGGSDPDDIQSMIHYLFHADLFDLEGIIISRPGGRKQMMKRVLRAYRRDYPKLAFHSADYPTPSEIKKLIRVGAERNKEAPPQGFERPTKGSRLIVRSLKSDDPRPLHFACWGASTDIAQALHDLGRKERNRIFNERRLNLFCGDAGFNNDKDPYPTRYLKKFKKLRWVGGYGTGRGLYWGGLWSKKKYGNIGFVNKVLAPSGAMGRLYKRISKKIDVNTGGIKMGDSITILFIWKNSFEKPWIPNWGGRFCKVGPNRFKPCKGDDLGGRPGGASVAPYRIKILKAWEKRINRLNIELPE
jgi:hypothetical protein